MGRGVGGGRSCRPANTDAFAVGERRASRGQDDVSAVACRTSGGRGLDRVRGGRRRSDGGAAVVWPARRPHPTRGGGASRLPEAHLVYPPHAADGAPRHPPKAGGGPSPSATAPPRLPA